jgi:hypothetical protein
MMASTAIFHERLWSRLRWVVWGGALALLSLPLVAMALSVEGVVWDGHDFAIMGVLFGLCCIAYEVAVRVARSNVYVLGAGLATATAFGTIWVNLAVGIIGDGGHWANLLFFGVVLLALVGTAIAKLASARMAVAMEATATAQALVGVVAFLTSPQSPEGYFFAAFLAALWVIAGQLFRTASRQEAAAGAAA